MGATFSAHNYGIYFTTSTVVDWIDVFTRKELAEIIIESLKYCHQSKGLIIYAWCLMPSHLHLISGTQEGVAISDVMRDFKKFTSKKVLADIQTINESRKEWLVDRFEFAGRFNSKIKGFKFWQDGFHPVDLYTPEFTRQKLEYLHNNPVAAGIVREPQHYLYSSAADYCSNEKGLLPVTFLS